MLQIDTEYSNIKTLSETEQEKDQMETMKDESAKATTVEETSQGAVISQDERKDGMTMDKNEMKTTATNNIDTVSTEEETTKGRAIVSQDERKEDKTMNQNELMMTEAIIGAAPTEESATSTELTRLNDLAPVDVVFSQLPFEDDEYSIDDEEMQKTIDFNSRGKYYLATTQKATIQGSCGAYLKAAIFEDEKNCRKVDFSVVYPDGTPSASISVLQSDIMNYCMFRALTPEMIKGMVPEIYKALKKKATNVYTQLFNDYCNTMTQARIFDIEAVIMDLCAAIPSLPIYTNTYGLTTPYDMYQAVVKEIKRLPEYMFKNLTHKKYFVLDEFALDRIAISLKDHGVRSWREIIRTLSDGGYLYTTPSAKGYQVRMKYHDKETGRIESDWFYCVYTPEYINSLVTGCQAKQQATLTGK